jgi:hypothetical protein
MWAGLWFLTELGVEDAAEEHADEGVHGLREGEGEGLPPVLRYCEGDAPADVGSVRTANLISTPDHGTILKSYI